MTRPYRMDFHVQYLGSKLYANFKAPIPRARNGNFEETFCLKLGRYKGSIQAQDREMQADENGHTSTL